MKKIGSGWQVFVYEYDTHTVYKKVKTSFSSLRKILADMPLMVFRPRRLFSWARKMKVTHLDSINYVKNNRKVWEDLGRPVIEESGNYYQDKVVPLGKFLKGLDEDASRKIIDETIALSYKLFQEGFIDKSFNILINFGISHGRVVLSDIGELFHGERMMTQIEKRPWVKPYVLRFIVMQHRDYFVKEMDKMFLSKRDSVL